MRITLCNETTGLTAILTHPSGTTDVHSSAHTKDTLSCIGRALPFYSRSINFISGLKSDNNLISKRYSIDPNNKILMSQESQISFNNTVLKVHLSEVTESIVYLVSPSSPFHFMGEEYNEGDVVYMPEKSAEFETLARKVLSHKGASLNVVRRGDILRIGL